MEQQIKDRYTPAILQAAMLRYGVAEDQIRELNAFESFIYEFTREGQEYILRISHSLRRNPQLIFGEVDWINHLAAGGAGVARAVHSLTGNLVELIDDGQGGQFLATAFVKAYGQRAWELGWSPELVAEYGRTLARMHNLTEDYQPSHADWRRPDWNAPFWNFTIYLPEGEHKAQEIYNQLTASALKLPQSKDVYGLIHQDAHASNCLIDEQGKFTFFDFDDCGYSWYINDIAIVLFYAFVVDDDSGATARSFLADFLRGYRELRPIEASWLAHIPAFLKIREIELYSVVHRDFEDVTNIPHAWVASFMKDRKQRIESGVPVIDLDFSSF